MKLANATVETFIAKFGMEALNVIQEHEGSVYLATAGMFPQIDAIGKASGCVVPVNPETLEVLGESATELAMILFVDNLEEEVKNIPEHMRDRYMTSVVVHEFQHVKQIKEGRLEVKAFGLSIWEGQEYKLDMNGYLEFPWEREAYMAQFTYMLESKEQAELAYKYMQNPNQ